MVAGTLIALTAAAGVAARSGITGDSVSYRAVVRLVARATPLDGPTQIVGSHGVSLGQGQRQTFVFAADRSLCARRIGGAAGTGAPPVLAVVPPDHRRTIEVALVDAQTDRIRLDVTDEREDGGQASREERHLTLTEGSPHLLDAIAAAPDAARGCGEAMVTLELSASILESGVSQSRVLTYDIWAIDRDPSGRKTTRHEQRIGRQGQEVMYEFRPLQWLWSDLMPSVTLPIDADVQLYGWIRGRARADGQIDLSVSTNRQLSWTWTGSASEGSVGDGGQKQLTVQPGETVRLDLPRASGTSAATGPGGATATVDWGHALGDHTMSIVLTVK